MQWTQSTIEEADWFTTVPEFSAEVVVETLRKMARDPYQRSGDHLTIHWCDGFIGMCVDAAGAPGANRGGYRVDVDEFRAAADIEDVDEMDRVLTELRERGTQKILRLIPKYLPWVKRVERYEDTYWAEPDFVYEL